MVIIYPKLIIYVHPIYENIERGDLTADMNFP